MLDTLPQCLTDHGVKEGEVRFSGIINKINKRGTVQKRLLVVSTRMIFNLLPLKMRGLNLFGYMSGPSCRRIIATGTISHISQCRATKHFALHVNGEHDYLFQSSRSNEIVSAIKSAYQALTYRHLEIVESTLSQIREEMTTKKSLNTWRPLQSLHTTFQLMRIVRQDLGAETLSTSTNFKREAITTSDSSVKIEDFEVLMTVGRGAFGKVQLVRGQGAEKVYAMKTIPKKDIKGRQQIRNSKTEREVLEYVRHPFLVRLRFAFQTQEKLCLVMDFVSGGELFFHLKEEGFFDIRRARFYTAETALALDYLHNHKIIFRDLKPENILIGQDGHVKLTDFGLAKKDVTDGERAWTMCGTPEYLSPELLTAVGYTNSVDWWGLGLILYEMLYGRSPFLHPERHTMFQRIIKEDVRFPSSPQVLDGTTKDLIRNLLRKDPLTRFGFNQLKTHQLFDGIDWDALLSKTLTPPWLPPQMDQEWLRTLQPSTSEDSVASGFSGSCESGESDAEDHGSKEEEIKGLEAEQLRGREGRIWSNFTFVEDSDDEDPTTYG